MTYTNLELLRKEIADPYKYAFDRQTGDGETTVFKLSHGRVQDDTYEVFVDNALKTETTDYTIDQERGIVTFTSAPADTKEVEAKYNFSAFSDTELTEFLTLETDNVIRAAIRCINILLTDSARRFDYSSGQTEMKPSQVFRHLKELLGIFKKRLSDTRGGAAVAGRFSSFYETATEESTDLSRADLGINE